MSFISVFAYSILSGGDRTAQGPRAFPIGRFAVEDTTLKERSVHEAREAPSWLLSTVLETDQRAKHKWYMTPARHW